MLYSIDIQYYTAYNIAQTKVLCKNIEEAIREIEKIGENRE